MAETKTSGANTSQKEKASKKTAEPVYSAEELSNAADRFGTRKECVAAALKYYGKDRATVKEAKELINKFLSKEVK